MIKLHKKICRHFYCVVYILVLLTCFCRASEDLGALVTKEITEHKELLTLSKDKEIVVFIGNTGAGKSTVINLLAGKCLTTDDKHNVVLSYPDDPSAMEIGVGFDSITRYPRSINVNDLLFFDLPGLNDTGATQRHLINAAFIHHILTNANGVKFVFIAGQDEVTASRGKLLKEFLDVVKQLFPKNLQILSQSSIFICTKTEIIENITIEERFLQLVAPQYHDILKHWTGEAKRFFNINKPNQGQFFDADATNREIIKTINALTPQKIQLIDISVIHPYNVKIELENIFTGVMLKELEKFINIDERNLVALEIVINDYKKDIFWTNFNDCIRKMDEILLLQGLTEKTFNDTLEKFQNDHFRSVDNCVKKWEAQYYLLFRRLQAEFDEKIYTLISHFKKSLEEDLSLNSVICELDLDRVDIEITRLKKMDNSLALTAQVECELKKLMDETTYADERSTKIFEECCDKFVKTSLPEEINTICADINKRISLIEKHVDTKKLEILIESQKSELEAKARKQEQDYQQELARASQTRFYYDNPGRAPPRRSAASSSSGGINHKAISNAYKRGNVSQATIARRFGVSQSTVSRAHLKYKK